MRPSPDWLHGLPACTVTVMEVGILAIFQNYGRQLDDGDMVRNELRLADQVEELGFGTWWPTEHHFTDYSACPDNIQVLSYMAGRTHRIRLGTGAVIVPWNDPLRIVEKMAMLDHLSDGRAVLGLGRGLARIEYEHFGIAMDESRDRFDEGAAMIIEGLRTGHVEGKGRYYPRAATPVRPAPIRDFSDRVYCVGVSPESVVQAGQLGARLMVFSQTPWEMFAEGSLKEYRRAYRQSSNAVAPPPLIADLVFCHESPDAAEQLSRTYMSNYFRSIVDHYELFSEHFRDIRGYEFYATSMEMFQAAGIENAVDTYCAIQTWGTPRQILEKLSDRRELLGDFEFNCIVNYGGMPIEQAESSMRLFAQQVLPELQTW